VREEALEVYTRSVRIAGQGSDTEPLVDLALKL